MKTLTIIIITSLLTGTAVYFAMMEDFNSTRREESHFVDHVTLDNAKLKQFILFENKGINKKKFTEKYKIDFNSADAYIEKNSIHYKLLYFRFKNDALYDVE